MKNILTKISCCVLIVLSVSFYSCSENPVVDLNIDEGISYETKDIFDWEVHFTNQLIEELLILDTNEIYMASRPYPMFFDGKTYSNLSEEKNLNTYLISGDSKNNIFFGSYEKLFNSNDFINFINYWDGNKMKKYRIPDSNMSYLTKIELSSDNSLYIGMNKSSSVYKFKDKIFSKIPGNDTNIIFSEFFTNNNRILNVQYKVLDNTRDYKIYDLSNNTLDQIFTFGGNQNAFIKKNFMLSQNFNSLYLYNNEKLDFLFSLKVKNYENFPLKPDDIVGNMKDTIIILNSRLPYGIFSKINNKWYLTYNPEIFIYISSFDTLFYKFYYLKNTIFIRCVDKYLRSVIIVGKLKNKL